MGAIAADQDSATSRMLVIVIAMIGLASGCCISNKALTPSESTRSVGKGLPLAFEANQGQIHQDVKFLARSNGYTLFLTSQKAVFTFNTYPLEEQMSQDREQPTSLDLRRPVQGKNITTHVLRLQLAGANAPYTVTGEDQLRGKSNYFVGKDPKQWHTDIPRYARVRYANIYPGIDWVHYGTQGQLKSDFVLAPGADPTVIGLVFDGADKLTFDENGNLIVQMPGGALVQLAPQVYQEIDGARQDLSAAYVLKGHNHVGFQIAGHDPRAPLLIDPMTVYRTGDAIVRLQGTLRATTTRRIQSFASTYLGGNSWDSAEGIAVDTAGNVYVTGHFWSNNFPVAASPSGFPAAFVTKLNDTLDTLLYSTFLSGGEWDRGHGIAVDIFGQAYVTGLSGSDHFPVVPVGNSVGPQRAGSADAFVTKLNVMGNALIYSTYLGDSGGDVGNAIAVDVFGNAYVAGTTSSPHFPTTHGAYMESDPNPTRGWDTAFVTKLNNAGTAKVYSSYLGGGSFESAYGVAVDVYGNAHVTGSTGSSDFPTLNAVQPSFGSAAVATGSFDRGDAFVSKLNSAGSDLIYSTYLGGSGHDGGLAIAIDPAGNAHVTGHTYSPDFLPIANALQSTRQGNTDAFLTKLDPSGGLVSSSYLGGTSRDQAWGIAVDGACNAYISGETRSTDFPPAGTPFQAAYAGNLDAFVAKISAAGTLMNTSYLGGIGVDRSRAVATFGHDVYVTGDTGSHDFPVSGFARTLQGEADAYVFKFIQTLGLSGSGVEFSAASYTVSEQQANITIPVVRRGIWLAPLSVHYHSVPGTAAANTDYQSASGVLHFAQGESTKNFTIHILPDAWVEPDETVALFLSDPECATSLGAQRQALLTITDPGVNP